MAWKWMDAEDLERIHSRAAKPTKYLNIIISLYNVKRNGWQDHEHDEMVLREPKVQEVESH